jgi:hypothetical protein
MPEFFNGTYMFNFKPCFITGISTNYAPQGVPSFFKGTRAPTEVEITIQLSETEIFTRRDFAGSSDRIGSGVR